MKWLEIENDGLPKEEGHYMVRFKHINFPYNVSAVYFNGARFDVVCPLPITHWAVVPPIEESNE
jgi:hypothetical protein